MFKKIIRDNWAIFVIFLISLSFRVYFLSPWLEDWDSVQFALAIHDFDITKHQPHAPGYPIYILLARILYIFTRNDTLSLTLLSATLGSFCLFPLFFLTQKMFGKREAYLASILFSLSPISLMMSISALTNIPGLFFLLVFIYLAYTLKKTSFVSFFGGLILGVRVTELPIVLGILSLRHIKTKETNLKKILNSAMLFLLGASIWLIPLVVDTGVMNFIDSYKWIAGYVINHDTALPSRLESLLYLLKVAFTPLFLILIFFSLLFIFTNKLWKNSRYLFLLIWLISYAIPLAFVYNLEVPRYTLPLLPPMAIIAASVISKFPKPLFLATAAILIVTLSSTGLSQVKRFSSSTPPDIKAVKYVQEKFSPSGTIILSSYIYRQFQYYLPTFKTFYSKTLDANEIGDSKILITDYIGLKNNIPREYNLKNLDELEFTGDKDVFSRLPTVSLYVYQISR